MVALEEMREEADAPHRYFSLIDGEPVDAESGKWLDIVSPSDGRVFAAIPRGGAADIDRAVKSARRAFEGPWSQMAPADRGRCLMRLSHLIAGEHESLSALEARDVGKSIRQARGDVTTLSRYFEFYAGAADKIGGETIPLPGNFTAMTFREPHGVVGAILPWNSPTQMFGRTTAPALAMGNVMVIKPAEDACLSILRLAQLVLDAGIPPGVVNVVTGLGEEAGAALAAHPDVNFLTFTGSPEVGTLVQKAAARRHIKCVLELGGKSPQVVFADADRAKAIPAIVRAITQNGGQTCSAGSRLLVEQSIYDHFVAEVAEAFAKVRVGTPEQNLDLGPMISAAQRDRVDGFVQAARAQGVPVLAEGRLAENLPRGGFYVTPTLFGPVPRGHRLASEEVFGPVLSVMPFDDEADALALANATDYGLVAGIWTRDGSRQTRVARGIRSGQVFINCYGAGGGVELPFGGVKKSGHGREKGFLALEEFSVVKTIVQYFAD